MKFFPLKLHEYLLLFTGIGMIVVLPWFQEYGVVVWNITKSAYLVGVVLFIVSVIKDSKNVRN